MTQQHRLPFFRRVPALVCALAGGLGISGVIATLTAKSAPQAASTTRLSLNEARADFDQLATIVAGKHPKLFADRAELAATIAAQRALLRDGMSGLELIRVLAPVSHATRCAHTRLDLPETGKAAATGPAQLLPFQVRLVKDQLFAFSSPADPEIAPGAEILSIDGRATADILALLRQRMPVEGKNPSFGDWLCDRFFAQLYRLYIDDAREFAVVYSSLGDPVPRLVFLPAIDEATLNPPAGGPASTGPNHFTFASDHAVLKIESFNFYADDERRRFQSFVRDFFGEARKRGIANLILDLRDNTGGDPYCAATLFAHLIDRPAPYFSADSPFYPDLKQPQKPAPDHFSGRLFILINGGCFSSTGHLCALLKYNRCGVFIGGETGGSYACTDASDTTTLAHSKIRFRHSTLAFKAAVSGLTPGRGTQPDFCVPSTVDDALQGRDPIMVCALDLIKRPAPPPLASIGIAAEPITRR